MHLSRRALLLSIPGLGAVPAYAHFVETRWFERTVKPVRLAKLHQPVRLLHLADLHASPEVPLDLIDDAISLGLEAKPDVICLTGDFISRDNPIDETAYSKILARLSAAAPTFACLGNHDGGYWSALNQGFTDTVFIRRLLAGAGVELLFNASRKISLNGEHLQLVGVADFWSRDLNGIAAFAGADHSVPVILLAHNPDSKDVLADHPWDLMLSGHTHGGQILIPGWGERFAPVIDRRFVSGLKPWAGRQVYVTRGVGSLMGVRFNCRPEVTILDLLPNAPASV